MPPFERACSYCLGMVQVWWGMEKYGRPYLRVFVSRARVLRRSARRAGVGLGCYKITPMEFVSEWESAIDNRAGLEDVGNAADTAYINASAAANTAAQRRAIGVIVAKDGKLKVDAYTSF